MVDYKRLQYCIETMLSTGKPMGIATLKAAVLTDMRGSVQNVIDDMVNSGRLDKIKNGKYVMKGK